MCVTGPYSTPLTRGKEFVSAKPRVLGMPSTSPLLLFSLLASPALPSYGTHCLVHNVSYKSRLTDIIFGRMQGVHSSSVLRPFLNAGGDRSCSSQPCNKTAGGDASSLVREWMVENGPLRAPCHTFIQLTDCAASITACQRTYGYTGQRIWYLGQQWTSLPLKYLKAVYDYHGFSSPTALLAVHQLHVHLTALAKPSSKQYSNIKDVASH
ncbi:hypothetical protein V8C34DRAFT_191270 [Trichoderma compactum]